MSSTDDGVITKTPHNLVGNVMGVGAFVAFFFLGVIAVVWVFSTPCSVQDRVTARGVSILIFLIVFAILEFAPKTDSTTNTSMEDHVYDHTLIPRVFVSIIMCIFSIVAIVLLLDHWGQPKQLSNIEHDVCTLWEE